MLLDILLYTGGSPTTQNYPVSGAKSEKHKLKPDRKNVMNTKGSILVVDLDLRPPCTNTEALPHTLTTALYAWRAALLLATRLPSGIERALAPVPTPCKVDITALSFQPRK